MPQPSDAALQQELRDPDGARLGVVIPDQKISDLLAECDRLRLPVAEQQTELAIGPGTRSLPPRGSRRRPRPPRRR